MMAEVFSFNVSKKKNFRINYTEIKKTLGVFGYDTHFLPDEERSQTLSKKYEKKVQVFCSANACMILFYDSAENKVSVNVCSKEDYDETVKDCLEGK